MAESRVGRKWFLIEEWLKDIWGKGKGHIQTHTLSPQLLELLLSMFFYYSILLLLPFLLQDFMALSFTTVEMRCQVWLWKKPRESFTSENSLLLLFLIAFIWRFCKTTSCFSFSNRTSGCQTCWRSWRWSCTFTSYIMLNITAVVLVPV